MTKIGKPLRIIEVEPEPATAPEPKREPAKEPVKVPEKEPAKTLYDGVDISAYVTDVVFTRDMITRAFPDA